MRHCGDIKDENILGGEPVFRGTRVPFKILIDKVAIFVDITDTASSSITSADSGLHETAISEEQDSSPKFHAFAQNWKKSPGRTQSALLLPARLAYKPAGRLVASTGGEFGCNDGWDCQFGWLRGPWKSLKQRDFLVAGACNHPNLLVLPFSLSLIRSAA